MGPEYTRKEGECPDCEGELFENSHTTVCGNCYVVLGYETYRYRHRRSEPAWEYFEDERDEYRSQHKKCVGGYWNAYEWADASLLGKPLQHASPDEFYL